MDLGCPASWACYELITTYPCALGRVPASRSERFRERGQIDRARSNTVWNDAQLLDRKIQAIAPEGRISKSFGARRVPAAKRSEDNLLTCQLKRLDRHPIGARIGLER